MENEKTPTATTTMEKIVSLAKRRGFIFQSSEIYGGLNSCWDYGPLGVELKNNVGPGRGWFRSRTVWSGKIPVSDAHWVRKPVAIWKAFLPIRCRQEMPSTVSGRPLDDGSAQCGGS